MVECKTHFRQLLRIIWTNVNATSRCKDFLLGFWVCCFCMILLSLGFYVFGRYNFSESTFNLSVSEDSTMQTKGESAWLNDQPIQLAAWLIVSSRPGVGASIGLVGL